MSTLEIVFIVAFTIISFLWYEKKRKKIKAKNEQVNKYYQQYFLDVVNGILEVQPKAGIENMTLDKLKEIHSNVFSKFIYVHDDKNYGVMEDWRSHAKTVNEGSKFKDDCDGFAFTMCELMLEAGFDKSKVMFIVCETETQEGHAVAGCEIDGVTYIAENRFQTVEDWNGSKHRGYKWFYFMRFDVPGKWYEVVR